MLANGITLSAKVGAGTLTNLAGLMEVPELGLDPEKVEITTLSDTAKQYEFGIGDYGDLEYTFKFVNKAITDPYRVLKGYADAKTVVSFEHAFPDGTKFAFSGMCNVKVSGGGVNTPITFKLQIALQSGMTVTNPA